MRDILTEAYRHPHRKCFFYTGNNHPDAGKVLGKKQWDWTPQPTVNIEPWYSHTHTLALAFGAPPCYTSGGKEWVQKIITGPADVSKIKIPPVWSGRPGQLLDKACEMLTQLPEETLIRLPDIQSPLGVAELLWDESFYTSFLIEPQALHELLEKITSFIIAYITEWKKVLGHRLNAACHPHLWATHEGYYISDDVNSMISPEQHEEFSIPYINKITQACGHLFYHSCTWTPLYFENIRKIHSIKAANWSTGTSADPALLIKEFSGQFVLAPHIGLDTHTEEGISTLNKNIRDAVDLVRYYLDSMQENTTMYMVLQEDLVKDEDMIQRLYRLFDERGYTPEARGLS